MHIQPLFSIAAVLQCPFQVNCRAAAQLLPKQTIKKGTVRTGAAVDAGAPHPQVALLLGHTCVGFPPRSTIGSIRHAHGPI